MCTSPPPAPPCTPRSSTSWPAWRGNRIAPGAVRGQGSRRVQGGGRAEDRVGLRQLEDRHLRPRLRGQSDAARRDSWIACARICANTLACTSRADSASVTFLGIEPIEVLRFARGMVVDYVSLGCSRHPMTDPAQVVVDPLRGPRAEVVLRLRNAGPMTGLARTMAVLAATPAVDGVVLVADALIDLGSRLWSGAPFTAVLLGPSDIPDAMLPPPCDAVRFLSATPLTATEAAWVRLKGAEAMRQAWQLDEVDVLDPNRPAAQPGTLSVR